MMGSRHALAYRDHPSARLVGVVDIDLERAHALAAQCSCPGYRTVEELLGREPSLGAVSVAVPTTQHAEVTLPLIMKGIACLVEKALAHTEAQARALLAAARSTGTTVMVGHIERFNPAVKALARTGEVPLLMELERVSPMPFRALDVDVIFDLMIHDLDIVLWLTGLDPRAAQVTAFGMRVDEEPLHLAKARLVFPAGPIVDLTASRLALESRRKIRLFGQDSYISADCQGPRAIRLRRGEFFAGLSIAKERYQDGNPVPTDELARLVNAEELIAEADLGRLPLEAEITEFLTTVIERREPAIPIEAGVDAVALAERVGNSVRDNGLLSISRSELPASVRRV